MNQKWQTWIIIFVASEVQFVSSLVMSKFLVGDAYVIIVQVMTWLGYITWIPAGIGLFWGIGVILIASWWHK